MNQFQLALNNPLLVSAVLGWLVAQVLKTFINLYFTKTFDFERLFGSGGMPSSHSATVCALATAAGMTYGCDSAAFGISCILAIIVMYDARGVRRETGKQAIVINELVEIIESMNLDVTNEEKLKVLVGHTPLQVLMGSILGIVVGVFSILFLF